MRISDWSSDVCSSDLDRAFKSEHVIMDRRRRLLPRDTRVPPDVKTAALRQVQLDKPVAVNTRTTAALTYGLKIKLHRHRPLRSRSRPWHRSRRPSRSSVPARNPEPWTGPFRPDRKSKRLNSSH